MGFFKKSVGFRLPRQEGEKRAQKKKAPSKQKKKKESAFKRKKKYEGGKRSRAKIHEKHNFKTQIM